jgi:hypothetical protein
MKTNQLKETMKTTYQSKNWDKKLFQWCKENRKAKAIRKSFTKKQKEQVQKDLEFVSNFVKQTLKNMEKKQIN